MLSTGSLKRSAIQACRSLDAFKAVVSETKAGRFNAARSTAICARSIIQCLGNREAIAHRGKDPDSRHDPIGPIFAELLPKVYVTCQDLTLVHTSLFLLSGTFEFHK